MKKIKENWYFKTPNNNLSKSFKTNKTNKLQSKNSILTLEAEYVPFLPTTSLKDFKEAEKCWWHHEMGKFLVCHKKIDEKKWRIA